MGRQPLVPVALGTWVQAMPALLAVAPGTEVALTGLGSSDGSTLAALRSPTLAPAARLRAVTAMARHMASRAPRIGDALFDHAVRAAIEVDTDLLLARLAVRTHHGDWRGALAVVRDDFVRHEAGPPPPAAYADALRAAADAGEVGALEEIWDALRASGTGEPTAAAHHQRVRGYARAHRLRRAFEALEALVAAGHTPVGEHLRLLRFRCFEHGRPDLADRVAAVAPGAATPVPRRPVSPMLTHVPPVPGTPAAAFPAARPLRRRPRTAGAGGDDDEDDEEEEEDKDDGVDVAGATFRDPTESLRVAADREDRDADDPRVEKGPKRDRRVGRGTPAANEVVALGGSSNDRRTPGWRSRRAQAEAAADRRLGLALPDQDDDNDDDAEEDQQAQGGAPRGRSGANASAPRRQGTRRARLATRTPRRRAR
jgi:hypothetical protein